MDAQTHLWMFLETNFQAKLYYPLFIERNEEFINSFNRYMCLCTFAIRMPYIQYLYMCVYLLVAKKSSTKALCMRIPSSTNDQVSSNLIAPEACQSHSNFEAANLYLFFYPV